jgi:hypothetical protein
MERRERMAALNPMWDLRQDETPIPSMTDARFVLPVVISGERLLASAGGVSSPDC